MDRSAIQSLSEEELDEAVKAEVLRAKPNFEFSDSAFCPTQYWEDCGPLIELFRMDVGPHNGGWLAYCNKNQSIDAEGNTAKIAICRAILISYSDK